MRIASIKIELQAFVAALMIASLSLGWFAVVEPSALTAQEGVTFTITQTITGETSFTTDPNSVALTPNIASITGGTSNGTSTFVVQTNNSTGYNVTLVFSDDEAMQLDGGGGDIPDYVEDTPGEPDFGFDTSPASAQFGFSVVGATATDVDPNFRNDGGSCATGSLNDYAQCWSAGSTTAVTILNSSSATSGAGATSSLLFQVYVPPNPTPAVPAGDYTATATLTVAENP